MSSLSRQELTARVFVEWEETRRSLRECVKKVLLNEGVRDHRVWGTIHAYCFELMKRLRTVDAFLEATIRNAKLFDLDPWVRNALRVGTFEMKFNDVKPAIATNEAVKIVVECVGEGPARFVNAVLYDVERLELSDVLNRAKDTVERLAIEYSHPEWFVKHLMDLLGENELTKLMDANNREPERYLRVHAHMVDPDKAILALEDDGVAVEEDPDLPFMLRVVDHDVPPVRTEPYRRGWVAYQDKASAAAAYALRPEPGDRVLDACAAPGGKSAYLYALTEGEIELTCVDVNPRRLREMRRNFRRWGIEARLRRADSSRLYRETDETFDLALVDPPCSSSGAYVRAPEAKWTVKWRHVKRYARGQLSILRGVAPLVERTLVYSTCSVTVVEDESVVRRFLREFDEFEVEEPFGFGSPGFDSWMNERYPWADRVRRFWPHRHRTEGFFVARLVRS
ncbi:RsmB/NOP family class I SAM-dependent RNA methyltransferase [Methanopyrus kandleri]|uniref:tRNA/rRNA cytosine-C5-methylase n=2 Tax=Methanopyrus kandleri TaxID=2320 RepID=Q8TGZ4_METKA|nr:RsmB/NOP family class I SAM-dependent RNA methyltransferase [Methanopyrus kandleri]AAM01659.1 tRNA/rRNA cytosine-C5-methylase [Methanopyrus kandleri AV19]HII70397.1 methyltransferase domain-containing protein [Methanopyrus kandleri]